jgi:hypothetical protein
MSNKVETCGSCPFNDSCYFSGLGDKSCDAINKFIEVNIRAKDEKLDRHAERVEHVKLMRALDEYTKLAGSILDAYDNLANDEKEEIPESLKHGLEMFLQFTDLDQSDEEANKAPQSTPKKEDCNKCDPFPLGRNLIVTQESWEMIIDLIKNPPEPTEALKKLFGIVKQTDKPCIEFTCPECSSELDFIPDEFNCCKCGYSAKDSD